MVNWNGINEFVSVAETGSFTAAAKQLGLSTGQVSKQISELEARLSTRLFNRTTRNVAITEHGRIFYNRCRQVQDSLSEAERYIAGLHDLPFGRLRITAPIVYGQDRIAPLINDFLLTYPELDIHLSLTNDMVDLVQEGYDLAIRLGKLESSSMIANKLTSRTLFACASPAYLEKWGTPDALSDLTRHNCLVGSLGFWRFRDNRRVRNVKVHGNLTCNNGRALLDAALKGIGLIQLPNYYVEEHFEAGRLIPVLDDYRETEEGVWALYPHNRQLSPNVRFVIDYLKEHL